MSLVEEVESSLSNKGDVNIVVPYLNRHVRRIMEEDNTAQDICTYVLNREESVKGTGDSFVINYQFPNTLADILSDTVFLYNAYFFITKKDETLHDADSLDEFLAYAVNDVPGLNLVPSRQEGDKVRLGHAYGYEHTANYTLHLRRLLESIKGDNLEERNEQFIMPIYTRVNVMAYPSVQKAKHALQPVKNYSSFSNYHEQIGVKDHVKLETEPKSLFNHTVSERI